MKRFGLGVLVLLIVGLTACAGPSKTASPSSPAPQSAATDLVVPESAQGIRTVIVARQQIPDYLEVPGRIQADPTRVVRVFPPVGGRLVSVEVRPGDRVRKGQTLATLESSDVASARSDYLKARADSELKERAMKRASLLFENQVLSEKEYHQAEADAQMAKAELERARARLQTLGISPEGPSNRYVVAAPRAGVILDIGGAQGEFSKSLDSPAPLCTIADLSVVWAVGEVYEKDLAGLKADAPAQVAVSAYPDEKWRARVTAISSALDPVTRTLKLRVVLENPNRKLKPEMFISIRLLRSIISGLAIPSAAVVRENGGTYVFVQKASGHFERRPLSLGRTLDGNAEVTSGLHEGEAVVAEGALLLRGARQ